MCATTRGAHSTLDGRARQPHQFHQGRIRDRVALFEPSHLQSQSKDRLSQRGSTLRADYKGDDVHMRADANSPVPGNDGVKPPVSACTVVSFGFFLFGHRSTTAHGPIMVDVVAC